MSGPSPPATRLPAAPSQAGRPAAPLLPFIGHGSADAVVARRGGLPITARELLAQARRLAARLPAGDMLNACGDRYRFTVGLLAALLREQLCVLPNNLVAQTLTDLRERFPRLYQLTDREDNRVADLTPVMFDDAADVVDVADIADRSNATGAVGHVHGRTADDEPAAAFPADRVVACLFTSGSTGKPVAHPRTWGTIVQSARAEAASLGMDRTPGWSILGTVPPQHSYGLESTVHLALQGHAALAAEHPFFPADVLAALARLPAPRLLVTTPVHLRALLAEVESGAQPAPRVERVMSATAPLSDELAQRVEAVFGTELVEIYGSTESGQVALRRPTRDPAWQTLPGVRIELRDGQPHARDGHVGAPTPLADLLDLESDQRFVLRGRTGDMVNIAGKRSSIAFLDRQLLAIEGVQDGAFHLPQAGGATDQASAHAARLTAFVVAPALTDAQLLQALRSRIEAVFLPRPIVRVDALPRDGNGKLPRQRLDALARALPGHAERSGTLDERSGIVDAPATTLEQRSGTLELPIATDDARFDGHFPGDPMLPGACLLDQVIDALRASGVLSAAMPCAVPVAKFLAPVRPGDRLRIDWRIDGGDVVHFDCRVGDTLAARASARAPAGPR